MPDVEDFIQGFHLEKDALIDEFQIIYSNATHQAIIPYHEYYYTITLVVEPTNVNASYDKMFQALSSNISVTRLIYGVRNLYSCTIDPIKYGDIIALEHGQYQINLIGHSHRA